MRTEARLGLLGRGMSWVAHAASAWLVFWASVLCFVAKPYR